MAQAQPGWHARSPRSGAARSGLPEVVQAMADARDGAPQVVVLGLAARADRLDQRRKPLPLRVRQTACPMLVRHAPNMGTELKTSQALGGAVSLTSRRSCSW